MGNVSMEARDINYRGGISKMSVEDALNATSGEAAAIAALQEAVGNLQTDTGNLQTTKANLITIAPVFSEDVAYDPGDLVYNNGLTYRCTNAHEGEWDADDFAATTIDAELKSLNSKLNGLIVVATKTVTTDSDGDASLDINTLQGRIISVGATGVFVTAWVHSGDYKWYVRVETLNRTPFVGDASITYLYVPA